MLAPTPYSLIFPSCLLAFYGFAFGSVLSRGLLNFFPLDGSLQTQEVKLFSSNSFEDLELVNFALWFGMFKVISKDRFSVFGEAWIGAGSMEDVDEFFFSWICTFCAVLGVVGNVLMKKKTDVWMYNCTIE